MTAQEIDIEGVPVWAQRISYTGELGWELYIPWNEGLAVWDALIGEGKTYGRAHRLQSPGHPEDRKGLSILERRHHAR